VNLNPLTWPLGGKLAAIGGGAAVLAGAATTAVYPGYAQTPGEPGVATYLCSGSTSDMLLQWRDDSAGLSGTYQRADLSGQVPSEAVSSDSGELSGTLDATAITLSIGLSQPLYGSFSGSRLTVNFPQQDGTIQAATCTQASIADWNNMVDALNGKAGSDNSTAVQQQAQASSAAARQQAVSNAQQSLTNDVSALEQDSATMNNDASLASDISSMKQDYQTGQNDWSTEQSDSCSNVSGDASTVGGDASTVGGDLSTLQGDMQTLQSGDLQTVKNDLGNVQNDLTTLNGLGVAPGVNAAPATAGGNQALKNAAKAIAWANQNGTSINSNAQALANTAQNYANRHQC
jgi:hypothetical protein